MMDSLENILTDAIRQYIEGNIGEPGSLRENVYPEELFTMEVNIPLNELPKAIPEGDDLAVLKREIETRVSDMTRASGCDIYLSKGIDYLEIVADIFLVE